MVELVDRIAIAYLDVYRIRYELRNADVAI